MTRGKKPVAVITPADTYNGFLCVRHCSKGLNILLRPYGNFEVRTIIPWKWMKKREHREVP